VTFQYRSANHIFFLTRSAYSVNNCIQVRQQVTDSEDRVGILTMYSLLMIYKVEINLMVL
jgi:hypothetical protein